MFGRATIRLGIGPHSSLLNCCAVLSACSGYWITSLTLSFLLSGLPLQVAAHVFCSTNTSHRSLSHLFHNELNWLSVASCLTICAAWHCCTWWTSVTASTLHLPPSSWDTALWAQHMWPTGFCWMLRQSGTLFHTVSELLIAALTVSDISWMHFCLRSIRTFSADGCVTLR